MKSAKQELEARSVELAQAEAVVKKLQPLVKSLENVVAHYVDSEEEIEPELHVAVESEGSGPQRKNKFAEMSLSAAVLHIMKSNGKDWRSRDITKEIFEFKDKTEFNTAATRVAVTLSKLNKRHEVRGLGEGIYRLGSLHKP